MIGAIIDPAKDFPSVKPDACVGSCADRATGVGASHTGAFAACSGLASQRARRIMSRTESQPSNARGHTVP